MSEISAETARRPGRLLGGVGEIAGASAGPTAAGGTGAISGAPRLTASAPQMSSLNGPPQPPVQTSPKVPSRYAPKSVSPAPATPGLSLAEVSRVGWMPSDLSPAELAAAQAPAPSTTISTTLASPPRLRGDTAAQEICERLQAALFRIALAHDKAEPVLASITDRDIAELAGVGPEDPPPRPTLYFRLFPALRRLAEIAEREAVIAEAQAEEIDREL